MVSNKSYNITESLFDNDIVSFIPFSAIRLLYDE